MAPTDSGGNAAAPIFRPRTWQALGLGLVLTLVQIGLACSVANHTTGRNAYRKLFRWDGGWYRSVIRHGYDCPVPIPQGQGTNVAFFPGYPLCAALLMRLLPLRVEYALLATAQLACWGFWTYLLLILKRWRIPTALAVAAVLSILLHPAAFFLVSSYSESLFLMSMLGFLYWAGKHRPASELLAAGHGFLMTATRVIGLPLVIVPLGQCWLTASSKPQGRRKTLLIALGLAIVPSLGTLLYFGYCQMRFGHWDMYMRAHEAGWEVRPTYWAPLSPRILSIHWPRLSQGFIDPEFLSRVATPVMFLTLIALIYLEWRWRGSGQAGDWRRRAGFYICAGLMYYVAVSGHYSRHMSSMIRFSLGVDLALVLAAVHLLAQRWPFSQSSRRRIGIAWAVWCLGCFACQIALTYRYTRGKWVA
jgi:hypothetical protein